MTTETVMDDIIMTVYSPQGKNQNKIRIKKGLVWSQLKTILKENGYHNIDSMKAIENTKKAVLEHPKAIIPTEDFNLHLYPIESKGGAKSKATVLRQRKELCESIKKHIIGHGDKAKNFFSDDKSYTNKSTEELDTLLTKWEKKHGPAPDVKLPVKKTKAQKGTVTQEQYDTASDVVGSLKKDAEVIATPADNINAAISILKNISNHENQVLIEESITKLGQALITKPTPSEEELLIREHQELSEGLMGIRR